MAVPGVAFATVFGLALLQALTGLEKASSDANVLVSPLSGFAALTLALNAAGLPSPTHAELLRALTQNKTLLGTGAAQEQAVNAELSALLAAVPSGSGGGAADLDSREQVLLGNAIWAKKGTKVKKAYTDAMAKMFQAKAAVAESAADVNAWVAGVTQGVITQLLDPATRFDLILTNALYFKGKWATPFREGSTSKRPFTTATGAKREVDMMYQQFSAGDALLATAPGKFTAVRLPYRSGNFSAIAVLPSDPATPPESLLPLLGNPKAGAAAGKAAPGAALLAPLPGGSLGSRGAGPWRPPGPGGLAVSLPRFALRGRGSLAAPLKRLGVVAAFSEAAANFERVEGDPAAPFFVSDVIQEVVLNVDEDGTEAAAATAVIMVATSLQIEPPQVVTFDRPFLFALVHDASGVPLVAAVVRDPPPAPAKPKASPPPPPRVAAGARPAAAALPASLGAAAPGFNPGAGSPGWMGSAGFMGAAPQGAAPRAAAAQAPRRLLR
ncbi:MAG: Serpin domain-containing protein [Monoraphidium minutum]|nr:MAG: Serpin domain-containing protein [Monoraphidium minutum]